MLWAIFKGQKISPTPHSIATCPICNYEMIPKCGSIKIWHWAHKKHYSCDSWYEPETFWHMHWKMTFGKDHSEIVIKKNTKRHIADVLTSNNVVIELQNSQIQKNVIVQREEFYGERMIWLINGIHFKNNIQIEKGRHYDKLWFLKSSSPYSKNNDADTYTFKWSYPRKCWSDVKRPVFIDFGDDDLFYVLEGMGSPSGYGKYIKKIKFIEKYGGNSNYYHSSKK